MLDVFSVKVLQPDIAELEEVLFKPPGVLAARAYLLGVLQMLNSKIDTVALNTMHHDKDLISTVYFLEYSCTVCA